MTSNGDRPTDRRPGDIDDAGVSRLYRETAVERTPDRLDAAVLAAARRGAGNRYALSIHWLRPMAWAATIGLCLAIAIDVAILPDQPEYAVPGPTAEESLGQQEAVMPAEPATAIEMNEARREAPARAPADLRQDPDAERFDAPRAAAPVASPDLAEGKMEADRALSSKLLEAAADDAAALAPAGGAAELARDRTVSLCSAEEIASPEKWLSCIEALEAEGRKEEAALERERFERMFPNYALD